MALQRMVSHGDLMGATVLVVARFVFFKSGDEVDRRIEERVFRADSLL